MEAGSAVRVEEALGVASRHPIDLERIRNWCIAENEISKYEIFRARLPVEPS